MATPTQISISEYLHTSYRPDREYIDGGVRERNVGGWEHARVQLLLANWFATHETEWGIMASTEQRARVSETRVRVPDLVVVVAGAQPDVLLAPPVLGHRDTLSGRHLHRTAGAHTGDYLRMGVETIWLIDPKTRTWAHVHSECLDVFGAP